MKTLSTLLLAVAALAAAAPNAAGPEVLDPRQTCVYSCGCQTDDGSGIDPDTATCCANVGGSLGNDGTLCNDMNLATAQAYARCCGSSGGYVCFQSSSSCPPVTV